MECEDTEYGQARTLPSWKAEPGAVGRQLGAGDVGGLRLARAGGGARAVRRAMDAPGGARDAPLVLLFPIDAGPFMSNMDQISYWVNTKRAPCLMNYDNVIKRQYEATRSSTLDLSLKESITKEVPSPKKKKRKLSLLDDDASVEKQQNVYFEVSQVQRTVPSSCKSETLESDIDFNIKNSSIQDKRKRVKGQKNGRTLHKKNKVVTSTPLRRSLRRAQNGLSMNEHLNISFDTYNCSNLNRTDIQIQTANNETKTAGRQKTKKSCMKSPRADVNNDKKNITLTGRPKKETIPNGQFEDLSDVSGFTANYIRSTKLHSNSKPNRNLRSKGSRNLVKESQQKKDTTLLVCVNKSVNATAELPNASILNCSTDSSQNVINLITQKNDDNHVKVNRATSLLKFVDVKTNKPKENNSGAKLEGHKNKESDNIKLKISFQSKSTGTSRYPKRHKNHSTEDVAGSSSNCNVQTRASLDKRRKASREIINLIDFDPKENPDETSLSRTRSGRNLALAQRQPQNTVLVYNNSTEQVSTVDVVNVASRPDLPRSRTKPKRLSSHRYTSHAKRSLDKCDTLLQRDSVRERSGFAACFSDSDDGSETLKQRKFFC